MFGGSLGLWDAGLGGSLGLWDGGGLGGSLGLWNGGGLGGSLGLWGGGGLGGSLGLWDAGLDRREPRPLVWGRRPLPPRGGRGDLFRFSHPFPIWSR